MTSCPGLLQNPAVVPAFKTIYLDKQKKRAAADNTPGQLHIALCMKTHVGGMRQHVTHKLQTCRYYPHALSNIHLQLQAMQIIICHNSLTLLHQHCN